MMISEYGLCNRALTGGASDFMKKIIHDAMAKAAKNFLSTSKPGEDTRNVPVIALVSSVSAKRRTILLPAVDLVLNDPFCNNWVK